MKLAIVLLACMAMAAASYIKPSGDVKFFDKDMLYKQKFFTEVIFKVWEPLEFYYPEYAKLGAEFVFDKSFYSFYSPEMENFHKYIQSGVAIPPRGELFTVFNKEYLQNAIGLFKFFYYAKDYATLQKNICWARQYVNEGMFVYALQVFVMHHESYKFIVLPPMYEIFPQMFYNGKFIFNVKDFDLEDFKYETAYENKLKDYYFSHEHDYKYTGKYFDWTTLKFHFNPEHKIYRDDIYMAEVSKYSEFFKDVNMYWIKADFSDKYETMNEHAKLNYLTEDFDWNMFWYYFNLQYPSWMEGKEFNLDHRRGEYFMFVCHQLLARYHAERYSHGFGTVKAFNFYTPVEYGYNPQLVGYNGVPFSYRPNYYDYVEGGDFYLMKYLEAFDSKIKDVITTGYYVLADGSKFYFNKPFAIKEFGHMFQGNVDSLDKYFFENFMAFYHIYAAFGERSEYFNGYEMMEHVPSALYYYETMMRDPLFYQMYTKMTSTFVQFFKHNLGFYKSEDLFFEGVKITDVTTEKMYTYYDLADYDVSTLLDKKYFVKDGKFSWDYAVYGRRFRLNNKPFSITYDFESDKAQKIVFRTFFGPKYDQYGKELAFDYSYNYFYEIDQFYYEAVAGKNTYVRDSQDFFWTRKDHTTYYELYKYVFFAIEGKYDFPLNYKNKFCGFPERLILPRGWSEGMPMKLYVIATPYDASVKEYSHKHHEINCGLDYDQHDYGYPLDRPFDASRFWTPNMFFKDISIYHMKDYHMSEDVKYYFQDKFYY